MRVALLALLALAACEPKAPELDGAPSPKPEAEVPAGDLAGGAPAQTILLPGVMNVAAPVDSSVMAGCEKIVAPDYDSTPPMTCISFLRDRPAPAPDAGEFDGILDYQMVTAGWKMVRAIGAQRYFESPKPGADCADLAVVTALDAAQTGRLVKALNSAAAPAGQAWHAYAILATIRETCGADRMKP